MRHRNLGAITTMTDKIVESFAMPEIFADEVAQIHISRDVMRFVYWAWQMGPNGVLQRTIVARLAMPLEGVRASRPIITEAMQKYGTAINKEFSGAATAH